MTEFDFEELDKAVASAMGGDDDGSAKTTTLPTEIASDADIPVKIETPDVPMIHEHPQPPAVRRSRGRFMDIATRPSKPVVSPITQPNPETALSVGGVVEPDNLPESTEIKEAPHASNFHVTHNNQDDPLPSTPFLPDANDKIEKRPLNAGVVASDVDQETLNDDSLDSQISNEILEATPVTNEPPVLSDNQPTTTETSSIIDPEPLPEVIPSVIPKDEAEPTTGAIFDTSQYHKPIDAKKKIGKIGLTLWIVGLIAVGAVAGWAIYSFVLPMILG